jgi:hypothetical protein
MMILQSQTHLVSLPSFSSIQFHNFLAFHSFSPAKCNQHKTIGKCYINPFLLEEFLIIVGYVVLIFVLDVQQVQKQLSTVCFGVLTRLVFGKPAGWITFFYHYRAVTSSTGVGELVWNTV